MLLVTADEMRELDRRTIEGFGIPGIVLMERAGLAVADTIDNKYRQCFPGPILVLCGKGNNGGDGFVVGRILADRGWRIDLIVASNRSTVTGDAAIALNAYEKSDERIVFVSSEIEVSRLNFSKYSVIVDALLGTGLTDKARGVSRCFIELVNAATAPVVSVDISSGVDSSTGKICGVSVHSDCTVTFAAAKPGHYIWPGAGRAGEVIVSDIGIPRKLMPDHLVVNAAIDVKLAKRLLPLRPLSGHKGSFGHLLILAGSIEMSGAAELAVLGGLRSGAGLVTLACDEQIQPLLASKLIEAMTLPLPTWSGGEWSSALCRLKDAWTRKDALCIGPGLGRVDGIVDFLSELLLATDLPTVIDADALVLFEDNIAILRPRQGEASTVITPHPGELSRILACSIQDVESNRLEMALTAAERSGCVVVLKGVGTIVAAPDGRFRVNTSGNQGMAAGGMGDVLSGIIGGLLTQHMSAFDAASLGVYLHGAAGDVLAEKLGVAGLLASELALNVPIVRNRLVSMEEQ